MTNLNRKCLRGRKRSEPTQAIEMQPAINGTKENRTDIEAGTPTISVFNVVTVMSPTQVKYHSQIDSKNPDSVALAKQKSSATGLNLSELKRIAVKYETK